MDTLTRLQQWYASQCDGDWEHRYGIQIETLDNPGWLVMVHLHGTQLLNRPFTPLEEGTGNEGHPELPRWISCFVRDGIWHGAGDESQLERMLVVFVDWAAGGT